MSNTTFGPGHLSPVGQAQLHPGIESHSVASERYVESREVPALAAVGGRRWEMTATDRCRFISPSVAHQTVGLWIIGDTHRYNPATVLPHQVARAVAFAVRVAQPCAAIAAAGTRSERIVVGGWKAIGNYAEWQAAQVTLIVVLTSQSNGSPGFIDDGHAGAKVSQIAFQAPRDL